MESYSAWAAGVWISKSKRRAVKPDDRAAGGETRYAAIDLFMPCLRKQQFAYLHQYTGCLRD